MHICSISHVQLCEKISTLPEFFSVFLSYLCVSDFLNFTPHPAWITARHVKFVTSGVKLTKASHKKNIIATVKHDGGSVMVWGYFAASGPERQVIIDRNMNSALHQKVMKENLRLSVLEV